LKKYPKRLQLFAGRQGHVVMKHLSLKFALFGALFFAPVIISGCRGDYCDKEPETYYDIKGLKGSVLIADKELNILPNTPYAHDGIVIRAYAELDFIVNIPQVKGGANLYAFQYPVCNKAGIKGAKEKFKDITIKSNTNFRDGYNAGTDLNPLFSIEASTQKLESKRKLLDFLSSNSEMQAPRMFSLFFDLPPTQDKKHIFTIRYELDNGEVYTYTTPEITFQ
jgi:hypothetical protein